jgi:hypothetical protein
MPHLALAPLTGLHVRSERDLELGMTLPGLRRRAEALAELPALGLFTLAGLTPPEWTMSCHDAAKVDEGLVDASERARVEAGRQRRRRMGHRRRQC